MDFDDIIKKAILKGLEQQGVNHEGFSGFAEAASMLDKFLEQKIDHFKVGDYVEVNEYGKGRYQFPKPENAAKIVHIFDDQWTNKTDDENCGNNCVVAVAIKKDIVKFFPMDLRYLQKSGAKKNVHFFKKS